MSELAKALAELQTELPHIGKSQTADTGSYSYYYADLTSITEQLMPLLGKHGLAFTAKPTLIDGQFVLEYKLLHAAGESEVGLYPLPSGNPQTIGSAVTYARRYALCAVTGVAPGGSDDDGAAASQAVPQQPKQTPVEQARVVVASVWKRHHGEVDRAAIEDAFAQWTDGELFLEAPVERLREFANHLAEAAVDGDQLTIESEAKP